MEAPYQYASDVVLTSIRRRFNVMDVVWTSKRRRVLTGLLSTSLDNYIANQIELTVHYLINKFSPAELGFSG